MTRSWVEVNCGAIRRNTEALCGLVDNAEVCAVVKADGYGHGSVPVARAALAGGATRLAVAQVDEGVRLREAGIEAPIWVLSEPEPREFGTAAAFDLEPAVYTAAGIKAADDARRGNLDDVNSRGRSGTMQRALNVHLKIDTGMHRVGVDPQNAVARAKQIEVAPGLRLASVWTHLAMTDEPDNPYTDLQMDRFDDVLASLDVAGIRPPLVHAANSGASIGFPRTHLDVVRCGIALYGLWPSHALSKRPSLALELEPTMRWLTRVGLVKRLRAGDRVSYGQVGLVAKDTTVVTLPVGYADGYRRAMWKVPGVVLIGGKHRSIVGVVTMDQIVVDVGDDPVVPGDEAVLMGGQGEAEVRAEDLADGLGTINYEIICSPSPRVERVYIGEQRQRESDGPEHSEGE